MNSKLEIHNDKIILSYSGRIDVDDEVRFDLDIEDAYGRLSEEGCKILVLGLDEVTAINSISLESVKRLHEQCERDGRELHLLNPQPSVMNLIRTCNLNGILSIVHHIEEI